MRNIIKALAVAGASTVMVLSGGSALAAPAEEIINNPVHIGHGQANFYDASTGDVAPSTDGSFVKWQTRAVDSPLDRNSKVLHLKLNVSPEDGNNYGTYSTDRSTSQNKLVENVTNLSFDRRTSSAVGGGAPRISVEFLNGDVAYLSAEYCTRELTIDNRWSRSDFTNAKSNCGFYVTGVTGGFYEADGVHSAFDVYAAAHSGQRVSQTYVVSDVEGNYILDRVSLGTAFELTGGNNVGVRCLGDETRC